MECGLYRDWYFQAHPYVLLSDGGDARCEDIFCRGQRRAHVAPPQFVTRDGGRIVVIGKDWHRRQEFMFRHGGGNLLPQEEEL